MRRRKARLREGFDVGFVLGRRLFMSPRFVDIVADCLYRRGLFRSPQAVDIAADS